MISWLLSLSPLLLALLAGLVTWFITALGAAAVFCFQRVRKRTMNVLLGFAAGVMLAASCWSLLQPAIEMAGSMGLPGWVPAGVGFLGGAAFLRAADCIPSRKSDRAENRTRLLLLSITLHNIPEGLAVGVAFGALHGTPDAETLTAAFGVALGIGVQNYPEGAAVSLPLMREGMSRRKSFLLGQATALVEPLSALAGAALVTMVQTILPWALSFAAGAMVLVAVHELIPECQRDREACPYAVTAGILLGFAVMMALDVALS